VRGQQLPNTIVIEHVLNPKVVSWSIRVSAGFEIVKASSNLSGTQPVPPPSSTIATAHFPNNGFFSHPDSLSAMFQEFSGRHSAGMNSESLISVDEADQKGDLVFHESSGKAPALGTMNFRYLSTSFIRKYQSLLFCLTLLILTCSTWMTTGPLVGRLYVGLSILAGISSLILWRHSIDPLVTALFAFAVFFFIRWTLTPADESY